MKQKISLLTILFYISLFILNIVLSHIFPNSILLFIILIIANVIAMRLYDSWEKKKILKQQDKP